MNINGLNPTNDSSYQIAQNPQIARGKKADGGRKSFFAGDMLLPQDRVLDIRERARKRATKVISDAFAIEVKIDQNMTARRNKVEELNTKHKENLDKIAEHDQIREDLKKTYQISDDSQEEKDLEALVAKQSVMRFKDGNHFKNYLDDLKANGLTEYQAEVLTNEYRKSDYEAENRDLDKESKAEISIIQTTEQERKKHRPILEAFENAEKILAAASKEIMGLIYEDAVETIEDATEEKAKQAEKLEEHRKEIEEFIERIKNSDEDDEDEYMEEVTKSLLNIDKGFSVVQDEVKRIVNKLSTIEDEVKGIKIDTKVQ